MDIDDTWTKDVDGETVRTARYGRGKRWRARWRDAGGVQRQLSFRTKPEAQNHLSNVRVQLQAGIEADPEAAKVTVRAYAERWRASAAHEEQTVETVARAFRVHLYPALGDRRITSIRVSDARAWLKGMDGLAESTVRGILGYVSAVFNAAVADRIIPSNPFKGLARGRPTPNVKVTPPSVEQVATMRRMLPPRLRAVVTVAAGAGLRLGEILGLEVDSVDFLRRVIHVRQQLVEPSTDRANKRLRLPKGRRTRDVPIPDAVVVALSEHLRQWPAIEVEIEDACARNKPRMRTARFIFSGPNNTVVRRKWWYYRWEVGVEREELGDWTVHDCRHFYASALIAAGETVKTVQARLGHASAVMTLDVYGHLWPDGEDTTRAAIAAALAEVDQPPARPRPVKATG